MLLRWFIEAADMTGVARDAGVSPATAYRYLHEALQVAADERTEPARPTADPQGP